jgi:hypothetical protein
MANKRLYVANAFLNKHSKQVSPCSLLLFSQDNNSIIAY